MDKNNGLAVKWNHEIRNGLQPLRGLGRVVAGILWITALLSPGRIGAASVTLAWDPNPETDITGYQLSYGTTAGVYPNRIDAGPNAVASVTGLTAGATYYFVVAATNQAGLQSLPSAAISYQIPVTPSGSTSVIPRSGWLLRYVDSQALNGYAATRAFDGDPNTLWATDYLNPATQPPHEIQIDLGATYPVGGFRYLPRQDAFTVGNIGQYEFYVSADGVQWGAAVGTGVFADSKLEKEVVFHPKSGRYVRLRVLSEISGDANCAVAELSVLQGAAVVVAVNQAPIAVSKSLTTGEDSPLAIVLDASDPDGNALSYTVVTPPAHGTLSGTAPNLSYVPAANYQGSDGFTFTANDGAADSAVATVNLTVTPVNDAPVFAANPILVPDAREGTAYAGQSLAGQAADGDSGDVLTYSKVSGPAWLQVAASGDLSGTPDSGSAGLNTFVVRATDRAAATGDAELRINVISLLPLPWMTAEVGTGQLAGSVAVSAGVFTQAGAGVFGGTGDKLRFTYQTLSGDGEIIARVNALQNTGNASRVGVMIRDSLATNAIHSFMGLSGSNGYLWTYRKSIGGTNTTKTSSTGTVPNTWLRLVRKGNTIIAYKSTNGTSWTSVGKTTVTMGANCYIGLAVASGGNTVLNTSQFSNVAVTP